MAKCGVPRIDGLLDGGGAPALGPGDSDAQAVGLVQELLRAQGFTRLPDMRSNAYGKFGDLTRQAVVACRTSAGLDDTPRVDGALLADLVKRSPANPVASRGYLTLALDFEYTDLLGLISLTSLFESGARFACLNLNTDRCGLSFGIIQWAQKPGRLHEIVQAFRDAAPDVMAEIAGSREILDGLLAHTARPNGGVDAASGRTLDARFDLVAEPWRSRFEQMGRNQDLQKVQIREASGAFQASLDRIRRDAPMVSSQRGFAFMLDLANQHGDAGASSIYRAAARPGLAEPDVLAAMEQESVRRVASQFGTSSNEAASTLNRRQFFRTTPWLSDAEGASV